MKQITVRYLEVVNPKRGLVYIVHQCAVTNEVTVIKIPQRVLRNIRNLDLESQLTSVAMFCDTYDEMHIVVYGMSLEEMKLKRLPVLDIDKLKKVARSEGLLGLNIDWIE